MKSMAGWMWVVLLVYWAALATATHMPPAQMPRIPTGDKTAHVLGYAGLALLLQVTLWASAPRREGLGWVVILVCACWGVVDELTQPAFGRSASVEDFYADVAGASLMALTLTGLRTWWRRGA